MELKMVVLKTATTRWYRYVCAEKNNREMARETREHHLQVQNLHLRKLMIQKYLDPSQLNSFLDCAYIRESLPGLTVLGISPSYLAPCSEDAPFHPPYPKPHLVKLCKI